MSMNLVRTGSSLGVGVISGALEPNTVPPLVVGTTRIAWSHVAEAVALLGGGALQMLAPFTMPNVVDGLVDGGAALLAKWATQFALTGSPIAGANPGVTAAALSARAAGYAMPSYDGARGLVGTGTPGVRKMVLS